MKAEYILELVKAKENLILALPTVPDRINKVIEIAKNAPISPDTPVGFEFVEKMNIESSYLIQALNMYRKSGRVLIIPNEFSNIEAKNVTDALNYIYDLCEKKG